MMSKWILGLILGSFATGALAQTIQSPFNRTLKVDEVKTLLSTSPYLLIKSLQDKGLKIFMLENAKVAESARNPLLLGLPLISQEQLKKFDLEDHLDVGDAMFISKHDPCCDLGDFVIVTPTVNNLTLIHESMHFLFSKQMTAEQIAEFKTAEQNVMRDRKNLEFRFDKVFRNWNALEDERWRNDISNVLEDYVTSLNIAVKYTKSEEVFIERSLQALTKTTSPYYDPNRLKIGEEYALSSIKYAAVKTADVEFILNWLQSDLETRKDWITIEEQMKRKKQLNQIRYQVQSLYQKLQQLRDFKLVTTGK